MHFMVPSVGAVTFNSVNFTVSSLSANSQSFVFLEMISERGISTCEIVKYNISPRACSKQSCSQGSLVPVFINIYIYYSSNCKPASKNLGS